MRRRSGIWTYPAVMAVATIAGLLIGLTGDAGWDAISWALLAVPVAVCAYGLWPNSARRPSAAQGPNP